MIKIGELLKQNNIKATRLSKKGKATLVDSENGRYVVKEGKRNKEIYDYLRSRNFDYFPKVIGKFEDTEITEYQDNLDYPSEQKVLDMIDLVALLHNKTTYHKDVDNDTYIKIYEDLLNNLAYLESYYDDMISMIESKVYASPSEYLFARNVSKIYFALENSKTKLETWRELVSDKKKQRVVVLHNNLDLSHFIKNDNSYLLSWDRAKFDMPLFEIYKLYRKNQNLNFTEILNRYESSYPLLDDEKYLLYVLITMPDILEFVDNEFTNTKKVRSFIESLSKYEDIISENNSIDNTNEI